MARRRCATPPGSLWLVKIEPGTYDLVNNQLTLCPQVDVEGSGEGVTLIKSQGFSTVGVAAGAVAVGELRSVSIENAGAGPIGAVMGDAAWSFRQVTVTASASSGTVEGIQSGVGLGTMDHVTVIATNGNAAVGVYSSASGAGLSISDSTITVKDASSNTGILSQSLLLLLNSKVASTGTDIWALAGIAKVYGSILMGTTLTSNTGSLSIATSEVAATSFSGAISCIFSFNPARLGLNSTCH